MPDLMRLMGAAVLAAVIGLPALAQQDPKSPKGPRKIQQLNVCKVGASIRNCRCVGDGLVALNGICQCAQGYVRANIGSYCEKLVQMPRDAGRSNLPGCLQHQRYDAKKKRCVSMCRPDRRWNIENGKCEVIVPASGGV